MTRGAKTKGGTTRQFFGRLTLVSVFFGLFASALFARAVHLQVLDKDFLNRQADTRHLRVERISAHRGTITDRNGEPLAISTPVDSVWANPKELAPAVDELPKLARVLGIDSQTLMRRITRSMDKEFVYLKRHLSPENAAEALALKLPGINVEVRKVPAADDPFDVHFELVSTGESDGVRVTALCPGYVATDMVSDVSDPPAEAMIQPADLAELAATVIALPNTASVAELLVSCRFEDSL